jgi:FlaA1/EpsC-like NDP-sugar epimerase
VNNHSKMPVSLLLRRGLLALLDSGLVAFSFYIGLLLRMDGEKDPSTPLRAFAALYRNLPWMVAIYVVLFIIGGLYSILWKYAGIRDLFRLCLLVGVSSCFVLIGNQMVHGVLYQSAIVISTTLIVMSVGGIRLAWRLFLNFPREEQRNPNTPLLIVGAGNAGAWAISLCKSKAAYGNPVVVVDDDPAKRNATIQGVPVRGTLEDIPGLCDQYGIREIIIAIPSLRGSRLSHVVDLCNATHCKVRVLNDPTAPDDMSAVGNNGFRELNAADFLSRDEVKLDTEGISAYLKDKVVMVTGGGGSIGSELCRQIMRFAPRQLLIFDIYENCAYELEMELKQKYGRSAPVLTLVGSIRDIDRLNEVFEQYKPSVVFHAAAHKHVPLMETSPAEAVKNNVIGTKNLLTSASEHGVERLVQLSTDKAVNPSSVMGCTKRICEMLIQCFAEHTKMRCVAVRFGNVLGSHGSVIPLFESQIRKGGPVTVTDPNIVRYFMTIPEAAQLVLQAGALAQSGSIYVLDMGKPVKIMDLARQLIRFYGYEPDVNMPIRVVGLRPGEKLYEELLMDEEQDKMRRTEHNKIYVAPPHSIDLANFYDRLQELFAAASAYEDEQIIHQLQAIVPNFHPNRNMMKEDAQPGA